MNILLASYVFYPKMGGIEAVSQMLAEEFTALGHQVVVVTQTPSTEREMCAYRVIRRPGATEFLHWMRWADVFFHNNISMQMIWPLLLVRKPWVVTHQTWISDETQPRNWQQRAKFCVLTYAHNIAISHAVAEQIRAPSVIIGNPYQDKVFCKMPEIARKRDLVFLGRLVSDKGVDTLLMALGLLAQKGITPSLTIVGQGAEENNLKELTQMQGIASHVHFVGPMRGEELVRLLNAHTIMVAPSRWREPFGVVALEGIACGCVLIGSQDGGLIDAMGPCGITFPNGDAEALACKIQRLLAAPDQIVALRRGASAHLQKHHAANVAKAYLTVFEAAIRRDHRNDG